jgi:hypothetical protein
VNGFLHVVLDRAHKLEWVREFYSFDTDVGDHGSGNWSLTWLLVKGQVLNSLEDLAHEAHDLFWHVTVRQDIKQVG